MHINRYRFNPLHFTYGKAGANKMTTEEKAALVEYCKFVISEHIKYGGYSDDEQLYRIALAALQDDPVRNFDTAAPDGEKTVITHFFAPEGWKLVPVEPNWEMLSADGCKEHHNGQSCTHHDNRKRIWRAMLAAVPAP